MAHIRLGKSTAVRLKIDGTVHRIGVREIIDEDDAEPVQGSSYRIAYKMVNGFWLSGWRHHDERRSIELSEHQVSREPPDWCAEGRG